MKSCYFGTIYTSFPIFILLDTRAIGYKWQEDRTGDRWTCKQSSHISNPQLQEEGESLIKKPGNPIGR